MFLRLIINIAALFIYNIRGGPPGLPARESMSGLLIRS